MWPPFIGEESRPIRCAKAALSTRSAFKPVAHELLRYVLIGVPFGAWCGCTSCFNGRGRVLIPPSELVGIDAGVVMH